MAREPRPALFAGFRPWLRLIRTEEWALFATWAVGIALCAWTGIDSESYAPVFKQYAMFFSPALVCVFIATRLGFFADERWRPRTALGRRIASWLFDRGEGVSRHALDRLVIGAPSPEGAERRERGPALVIDLEFLRLVVLLFANLTVYSNIKVHIPFINPARGDEFFEWLDLALFGESFIRSIETWFASNPGVAAYFGRVYVHDYFWMIVLVLVLYLRRDLFTLRWMVLSVCFVYIIGILMTVAYPSYGPCFVDPERYRWLRASHIGSAQGSLAYFFNRSVDVVKANGSFSASAFSGIAAFPSLHVAHMVILMVVALRTMPVYAVWLAWVTTATFLATIGFGWHYAVDALGGAILAVVVTEVVYRWLRRRGQLGIAQAARPREGDA